MPREADGSPIRARLRTGRSSYDFRAELDLGFDGRRREDPRYAASTWMPTSVRHHEFLLRIHRDEIAGREPGRHCPESADAGCRQHVSSLDHHGRGRQADVPTTSVSDEAIADECARTCAGRPFGAPVACPCACQNTGASPDIGGRNRSRLDGACAGSKHGSSHSGARFDGSRTTGDSGGRNSHQNSSDFFPRR